MISNGGIASEKNKKQNLGPYVGKPLNLKRESSKWRAYIIAHHGAPQITTYDHFTIKPVYSNGMDKIYYGIAL